MYPAFLSVSMNSNGADDGRQWPKLNIKPPKFKGDFDNSVFGNQMTLATPDFTPK
jgi:hypothetical protein